MQTPPTDIQSAFLQKVRERLSPNISFADEIADVLEISKDSAYRRIRGETYLSIEEIQKLCEHYQVSLDKLMSASRETISFRYQKVEDEEHNIQKWLTSILQNLEMINTLPEKELVYLAKDLPIWYYFSHRDLAAFKLYFWKEIIISNQSLVPPFNLDLIQKEILSIGERALARYNTLDSSEIWSEETANITLKQLEYSLECEYISSEQYKSLLEEFGSLLTEIKEYAATGTKNGGGKFYLYKNDIILADNTILFKMKDQHVIFKVHNAVNILTTSDNSICIDTSNYFERLKSKSIMISQSGERDRNKLFNSYFKKINAILSPESQGEE